MISIRILHILGIIQEVGEPYKTPGLSRQKDETRTMFIGPQVSFLQDTQFYGQAKSSFSAPFNPFAATYS